MNRLRQNLLTAIGTILLLFVVLEVSARVFFGVQPWPRKRRLQTLTTFVQKQDVLVLDLLPVLRAHQDDYLFYDYAHLRPKTHRIVAEAMFEALDNYQLASFQ